MASAFPNDPLSIRSSGAPGTADIAQLEAKMERLLMITEALWTILKEKHGLEEQELLRQVVQIDLRDGRLDGRVASTPPQPCPKCNRPAAKQSVRCMFCGEPLMTELFAR
ncbi:MAG: hypothetical protein WCP06_03075 [Verrucomicrobiota bacterium]